MKQFSLFDKSNNSTFIEQYADYITEQAETPLLKNFSFDIEATGRDPLSDTIVGISLCFNKDKAYYIPIRHSQGQNISDALTILKDIFEDKSISKIGHNLKYDILILRQEGINVKGTLYDTMILSYLLNPNKPDHSLEDVALEYLSHKKKRFNEILGNRLSFSDIPIEEATPYAAEDALLAMELKDLLFKRLKEENLEKLYFDIEMPLIYVLSDIENTGIKVDPDRLYKLSIELESYLKTIESNIYNIAGEKFNINSPKQLSVILFEKLGLEPRKKTKTGYSTGMDVLEEMAKTHKLPREILNYRTLYKIKTTYVDTLPKLINKRTGRIHTSFNQTVTATGRLSSSEPNLQNIPVRGQWGSRIREAFVADEGSVLISADYSQIELRVLGHLSGDKGLIDAFNKDIDIHSRTASEIFGIPLESVTDEMRRVAKTVNFGIVYGISPFGLSESLNISQKDAALYIESYFNKHPSVKTYIEETIKSARVLGYVSTLMGRKRQIPEINSLNQNIRQQAERLAINTPIQGTAADLIKIAMINVWGRLNREGLKTKMVLQIHDELLFETPEDEIEIVKEIIKHEMENAIKLSVPLKVDIGLGKSWAEVDINA